MPIKQSKRSLKWMFIFFVWCGVCESDLGGNNLEAYLREIADHGFILNSVRVIWRLALGSKLSINWVSAPK